MSTVLGQGKFLRLKRDGRWEFVERVNARGAVAIIAVTAEKQLVLTEQFRPAVNRNVIDLPAGLTGDIVGEEDEKSSVSAMRELVEETGYSAKSIRHLADYTSSPGLCSEIISLFEAQNIKQSSAGGGVDGEEIEVHTPALRGIDRWLSNQIAAGKLIDGKVYAALYFAKRRKATPKAKPRTKR